MFIMNFVILGGVAVVFTFSTVVAALCAVADTENASY